MRTLQHQKGVTAIGWMLIIIMIVCMALLALKILPIYLDGFSVRSVVSDLAKDPELGKLQPAQIHKRIMNRFSINSVTAVSNDDVYISPAPNGYKVEVEYEVRENVIGNLDIVVAFDFSSTIAKR